MTEPSTRKCSRVGCNERYPSCREGRNSSNARAGRKQTYHQGRRYCSATNKSVVGAVHTNTIEGFWSIFKRGVVGTFHKVSAKYMPLYVAEFQFRYNNRSNADIFGATISGC